ncbi:MAG TPA: transposase domain-containing protein, partial [Sandaracinaceae bacterium LLY-WYZ-13_1]|nr:transposase domain-containing protein [Sandaracinaceae bacterium LLY-WYZ-13_1]
ATHLEVVVRDDGLGLLGPRGSILGGCALNGVEPWAYLNDVMQRIVDGWPMSRLAELLPANYA